MRFLITGGDGFIGSHNAEYLLEEYPDSEVVIIDNLSRTQGLNSSYLINKFGKDRVKLAVADIRELSDIKQYFKDIDRVYHTAAQVAMTDSLDRPLWDYHINSTGTMNVLESVRKHCPEAPVIYCSTNKVYGDILKIVADNGVKLAKFDQDNDFIKKGSRYVYADKGIKGVVENDFHVGPEAANCPYGSSKMAGELWMKNYHDSYGIKTVRARMSCIYGIRQFGCEDQGWLSWFTIRTLLDKNIVFYGDGMQVRDALFCTDHARAFDLMAKTPECYGEVFNLGGGPANTISLRELIDLIQDLTGKKSEIIYSDWRHGDQKVYVSDISKLKRLTGFNPEVSVKQGVKKLINWTRDNLDDIIRV
ncbi:NAD-dependent epimerase/dehydratase family protein, partial [archaeon]|nr:NAD-dependent epimerase/dehydratase family protein [archaeon]